MKITCLNFKYDPHELKRWMEGDKDFVPKKVLSWIGPGRKNGYGYGEFWVERYLKNNGYEVINGEYNLLTDKSKYKDNNEKMAEIIGVEKYEELIKRFRVIEEQSNGLIAQPHIFAYNGTEYKFIEVKKDKDKLRRPHINFVKLIKEELGIDFTMFNLQVHIEEGITEIEV